MLIGIICGIFACGAGSDLELPENRSLSPYTKAATSQAYDIRPGTYELDTLLDREDLATMRAFVSWRSNHSGDNPALQCASIPTIRACTVISEASIRAYRPKGIGNELHISINLRYTYFLGAKGFGGSSHSSFYSGGLTVPFELVRPYILQMEYIETQVRELTGRGLTFDRSTKEWPFTRSSIAKGEKSYALFSSILCESFSRYFYTLSPEAPSAHIRKHVPLIHLIDSAEICHQ